MATDDRIRMLLTRWYGISLSRQFAIAGFLVLSAAMVLLGLWVTQKIEEGVTGNTAASAALYMESFVAPLAQELAHRDRIGEANVARLDGLLTGTELGRRVQSFKIWKKGGLIAYSSRRQILGERFPVTDNLRRAWAGEVTAEFDKLEDEEDALERASGLKLLEMYCPIHEHSTGRIIAVAEFYVTAEQLDENLANAAMHTWLVVAGITLVTFGALFGVVNRGSRTIERQGEALRARVSELSDLLQVNESLRHRVQRASQRTAELNERYLKRVSADLHDGPAQLLSLALLRLDALAPSQPDTAAGVDDLEIVRSSLEDAIGEIRNICKGLALPALNALDLDIIVRKAVHTHEKRTGADVTLSLDLTEASSNVPESLKICVYRFVQEGLNNAFRHAGGRGQQVACTYGGGVLAVSVADSGPGMAARETAGDEAAGLGLDGLRERVESLGGTFTITSSEGGGTRLAMRCDLVQEKTNE